MDRDRALFVFGEIPEVWDIDDPAERQALRASEVDDEGDDVDGDGDTGPLPGLMRATVLEQVASGRPAAVWATAQRLLAGGQHREQVIAGLVMAFTAAIQESFESGEDGFDESRYDAFLDTLPLPTQDDVVAAIIGTLRGAPVPPTIEELATAAITLLGCHDDRLVRSVVDYTVDELVDDGEITLLPTGRPVLVADLAARMVLTHRLTEFEQAAGMMDTTFDLAPFTTDLLQDWRTPDGEPIESTRWGSEGDGWRGPAGWLDDLPVGALVAVRLDDGGVVRMEPVDEPDALELAGRAVDAVDVCWTAAGLPLDAAGLAYILAADDPSAFADARPPLSELCRAAGLEVRGGYVAAHEAAWAAHEACLLEARLADRFEDPHDCDDVRRVLALAAEPSRWRDAAAGPGGGIADDGVFDALQEAAEIVGIDEFAQAVADELAPPDGPPPQPASHTFAAALAAAAAAAKDPDGEAGGWWLAAVLAERAGDLAAAEAHLAAALEVEPGHEPALERAAWYASDRGDAPGALRLLRRFDDPDPEDIRTMERYARPSGGKAGRNDPCWCGSGRKHKHCHLGRPVPWPLPDRVEWLCHKQVSFLRHRSGEAAVCMMEHALAWLSGAAPADGDFPEEEERGRWLVEAFSDPLVVDTVLVEGGFHEAFLAERGALLPDDEALLARSWTLVARTVYEIESVTPGSGVAVRDVRSGERMAVRERTFSHMAEAGQFVCGRAVPDGEGHQFVGGVVPVPPGTEAAVLDLCDRADGQILCQWAGGRHRPPRIATREGEPILVCRAEVEVPDPVAAAAVLDRCYDPVGPGWWHELHTIDDNDEILRAQLSLDGNRLVITTNADARIERVLEVIRAEIDGSRVAADDRRPLRPGEMPSVRNPPGGWDEPGGGDPAIGALATASLQEAMEQRWLDEPVPALGGLTPWQAAADPTRRDELARLLATFPELDPDSPFVALRPARLRQRLGLPPTGF